MPGSEFSQSCRLICVFLVLLLINKAFLQEITAVVGESIILPCSHREEAVQGTITVFWRHKDSKTVLDIIDNKEHFGEQEAAFRGRVKSFPKQWKNGDFSIRLKHLKETDSGLYTCFIPQTNERTQIQLSVKVPAAAQILFRHMKTLSPEELKNSQIKPSLEILLLFSAVLALILQHT